MKRRAKYGNKPVVIDGVRFASKAEARRYGELKFLERAGELSDLTLQPRYPLVVGEVKIGTYVGDFAYRNIRTGIQVTEDVKGVRTPEFKLKKLLVRALHGIDVVEIAA